MTARQRKALAATPAKNAFESALVDGREMEAIASAAATVMAAQKELQIALKLLENAKENSKLRLILRLGLTGAPEEWDYVQGENNTLILQKTPKAED